MQAVEEALEDRLAIVERDPGAPTGITGALERALADDYGIIEPVIAAPGRLPAQVVAEPFGARSSIAALRAPILDQSLAIVDLTALDGGDADGWATFAERFAAIDGEGGDTGLAIVLVEAPPGLAARAGRNAPDWVGHLRRVDLMIWADQHVSPAVPPLQAEMATTLSVELCGWRLDLGGQIARASIADLADPLGWLETREGGPLPTRTIGDGTQPFDCPVHLLGRDAPELQRRIWRAQLKVIYPWLEERRQEWIERYRPSLQVNDHLRALGVTHIDEIEIGALAFQLENHIDRSKRDRLAMLTRMRNRLAHRRPANPDDVYVALEEG